MLSRLLSKTVKFDIARKTTTAALVQPGMQAKALAVSGQCASSALATSPSLMEDDRRLSQTKSLGRRGPNASFSRLILFLRTQASGSFSYRNNAHIIPYACIMHFIFYSFMLNISHCKNDELLSRCELGYPAKKREIYRAGFQPSSYFSLMRPILALHARLV
jgi:hypothetical protein